jgi:hypothetical protein
MSVADECRKQAEICRTRAEKSAKSADRIFWLSLAENWQMLAQGLEEQHYDELKGAD